MDQVTLASARGIAARGQHQLAVDLLRAGLVPGASPAYLELLVQELCRADDVHEARRLFDELGFAEGGSVAAAALDGRICKDEAALMPPGAERRARFALAARRYMAAVNERPLAVIDAATTAWMAGDHGRARHFAAAVLGQPRSGGYADAAARGEALLVLGEAGQARRLFEQARGEHPSLAELAASRRQIHLMVAMHVLSAPAAELVLSALGQRQVIHYCGQMGTPAGGIASLSPHQVAGMRARIERTLAEQDVGIAYGGLASGGDILIAECAVGAGVELQVVVPFSVGVYRRVSVARFGHCWVERFDRLLSLATDVIIASDLAYAGDDRSFDFGTKLAMGLALQRARHLVTPCLQLAACDGRTQRRRPVGTEANLRYWGGIGQRSIVFRGAGDHHRHVGSPPGRAAAILLARIGGFQAVRGGELPRFLDRVLGRLAGALDACGPAVLWRAIWGDGMIAVFGDELAATRAAFSARKALPAAERGRVRFGLHFDRLPEVEDPVLATAAWFGVLAENVPALTEGAYVSEVFAARLAARAVDEFHVSRPLPVLGGARVVRAR